MNSKKDSPKEKHQATFTSAKEHKKAFLGGSLCSSNPTLKNYTKPIAIITIFHLFIAVSFNHFLPLTTIQQLTVIAFFCLLASTFPLSYLRLKKNPGRFIQTMYKASAFWLGTAINLTLAACVNWLIQIVCALLAIAIPGPAVFAGTMAMAILYSFHGSWKAFHPHIINRKIQIRDLPPQWHHKKIIHISDLHLGYIFGRRHLQQAVQTMEKLGAHMTAITGDLSDSIQKNIDLQIMPFQSLCSQMPVIFAPGNHDPAELLQHLRKLGVVVLDDKAITINGLQIAGVSCDRKKTPPRHLGITVQDYQTGMPTILLKHIPTHIMTSKASGVHLQLSGHTHAGQQFPFSIIAKHIYRRFNYGLHTSEDFSINTTSGFGTWGPPMRTTTRAEIAVLTLTPAINETIQNPPPPASNS